MGISGQLSRGEIGWMFGASIHEVMAVGNLLGMKVFVAYHNGPWEYHVPRICD